jgi:hypothetical protein
MLDQPCFDLATSIQPAADRDARIARTSSTAAVGGRADASEPAVSRDADAVQVPSGPAPRMQARVSRIETRRDPPSSVSAVVALRWICGSLISAPALAVAQLRIAVRSDEQEAANAATCPSRSPLTQQPATRPIIPSRLRRPAPFATTAATRHQRQVSRKPAVRAGENLTRPLPLHFQSIPDRGLS